MPPLRGPTSVGFAPNLRHLELDFVSIQLRPEVYSGLSTLAISNCACDLFQVEDICVLLKASPNLRVPSLSDLSYGTPNGPLRAPLQHTEPLVELKYLHTLKLGLDVSLTHCILSHINTCSVRHLELNLDRVAETIANLVPTLCQDPLSNLISLRRDMRIWYRTLHCPPRLHCGPKNDRVFLSSSSQSSRATRSRSFPPTEVGVEYY